MKRAAALLIGTTLALSLALSFVAARPAVCAEEITPPAIAPIPPAPIPPAPIPPVAAPSVTIPVPPPTVVYGATHAEAALTQALARYVTAGRMRLDIDTRAIEIRVPGDQVPTQGLVVENIYYSPAQGRFAADLVVPGSSPQIRLPVSGRAIGVVEIPVLSHRVAPGDMIMSSDLQWTEVRADQAGTDVASSDSQLLGQTPKRGIPINQPVRLRDVQSPRLVEKGALVTITLSTPTMSLSTQGKALQDGGKGEVIRVLNIQSNRIVEVIVAGPNQVAVAKPGSATAK